MAWDGPFIPGIINFPLVKISGVARIGPTPPVCTAYPGNLVVWLTRWCDSIDGDTRCLNLPLMTLFGAPAAPIQDNGSFPSRQIRRLKRSTDNSAAECVPAERMGFPPSFPPARIKFFVLKSKHTPSVLLPSSLELQLTLNWSNDDPGVLLANWLTGVFDDLELVHPESMSRRETGFERTIFRNECACITAFTRTISVRCVRNIGSASMTDGHIRHGGWLAPDIEWLCRNKPG